jgi:hypothetical protein
LWLIASAGPLDSTLSCGDALALAGDAAAAHDAGLQLEAMHPALDAAPESDAAVHSARDASVHPWREFRDSATASDAAAAPDATIERDAAAHHTAIDAAVDAAVALGSDSGAVFEVGPAMLRVLPFVSFPPGSFEGAASSLLVAAGCVGPVADSAAAACGARFAAPSALAPVWVPLSRVSDFRTLGLQFVNASTLERATLRSSPGEGSEGAYFTVASSVGAGEIAPRETRTGVALADLGADLDTVQVRIESGSGSDPLLIQSWADTLHLSGDLELGNAQSYSMVLLGPLGTGTIAFAAQPPRVIVIPNDPLPNQ